jgi:hypothetical protein
MQTLRKALAMVLLASGHALAQTNPPPPAAVAGATPVTEARLLAHIPSNAVAAIATAMQLGTSITNLTGYGSAALADASAFASATRAQTLEDNIAFLHLRQAEDDGISLGFYSGYRWSFRDTNGMVSATLWDCTAPSIGNYIAPGGGWEVPGPFIPLAPASSSGSISMSFYMLWPSTVNFPGEFRGIFGVTTTEGNLFLSQSPSDNTLYVGATGAGASSYVLSAADRDRWLRVVILMGTSGLRMMIDGRVVCDSFGVGDTCTFDGGGDFYFDGNAASQDPLTGVRVKDLVVWDAYTPDWTDFDSTTSLTPTTIWGYGGTLLMWAPMMDGYDSHTSYAYTARDVWVYEEDPSTFDWGYWATNRLDVTGSPVQVPVYVSGAASMVSAPIAAGASITNARMCVSASAVSNAVWSNVTAWVSADGGATSNAVPLVVGDEFLTGRRILSGSASVASGSNVVWGIHISTNESSLININGVTVQW